MIIMENTEKPKLVDELILRGVRYRYINIDIVFEDGLYKWEQVEIPSEKYNYGGVVDTLIQHKYPIDKMQAVINNYLLDANDAYAIEEFHKMQSWRKEAKEIAKEALLYEEQKL